MQVIHLTIYSPEALRPTDGLAATQQIHYIPALQGWSEVKMVFLHIPALFAGLAILQTVTARAQFHGNIVTESSDLLDRYDYVIVGGGLSGLVVANRLSEDPRQLPCIFEGSWLICYRINCAYHRSWRIVSEGKLLPL